MTAPVLTVRGGSNGVAASCEDIVALASGLGRFALRTGLDAARLHTVLVCPAVLTAAVFDPVGAAQFAGELLLALDGPAGMTWLAATGAELDLTLRSAALAYRTADRLRGEVGPAVRGLGALPAAITAAGHDAGHGHFGAAAGRIVAEDPSLADTVVASVSRFWTDFALVHAVATYPDGRGVVERRGEDTSTPATRPPRGVRDLAEALAHRDGPGGGGDIDVRFVITRGADGQPRRRAIIDVPGTKSWSPSPTTADVTSLGTNLRSITGARTSYESGVLEAIRRAGVRPDEPILFVGHSQGGMIAINAARHLRTAGRSAPIGVVTFGAPIARLPVPGSVTVLAVENDGDVIPHCDGATNPDRRNLTTVTVHRGGPDPGANHGLRSGYLTGATDIDESDDPSVRAALAAYRGFFGGDEVRTQVFHVRRRW